MLFDHNDILILLAMHEAKSSEKGASLRNIIAFADYVNHDILTHEEFNRAYVKLASSGLAEKQDNFFKTSADFNAWWDKTFKGKNVSPAKAMKEMTKFLSGINQPVNPEPERIAEEIFALAVKEYME